MNKFMYKKSMFSLMACAAVAVLCEPRAQASFTLTIVQDGQNVVGTGSGSLNLSAFTNPVPSGGGGEAWGSFLHGGSVIGLGPSADSPAQTPQFAYFGGIVGPGSFGSGPDYSPASGTGEGVNLAWDYGTLGPVIYAPKNYISGAAISDSSTWDSTTIAGLGLTPGTYVYTWGSGATADSFTIQIGPTQSSATPEPASILELGGAVGLLFVCGKSRRKFRPITHASSTL